MRIGGGGRGGGGVGRIHSNLHKQYYTSKDREACADSIDPNQMSQSVVSDQFATIQQFF